MAAVYDFRSGRSIRGCDPQRVGLELERLRSERGTLTPADVLEAAQDADSPLHPAFEWDDSEAARQHRLAQARRLIVSIRVLNSPAQVKVPAFVSVKTPDAGRTYMPTHQVMTDEQLRARLLTELRTFIESLERRYSHLTQVGDLLDRLRQQAG